MLVRQPDLQFTCHDWVAPGFSILGEMDRVSLYLTIAVASRPGGVGQTFDLHAVRVLQNSIVGRLGESRLETRMPERSVGAVLHLLFLHPLLEATHRIPASDFLKVRLKA